MGIYAVPAKNINTKTYAWYHFFIEMNKYFHFAKWKPEDYKLTPSDIALVFFDDVNHNDFSIIPEKTKKIGIVKTLNTSNVKLINECDYIVYLNEYQRRAAIDIAGINKPCISCPKHPTIDYTSNSFNTERFIFIGGVMTPEKVVGLTDRLIYLHELYPKDIEILIFPNFSDNEEWNHNFKKELSNIESHLDLKTRLLFVSGDVLNYNALKFRTRTAMHSSIWSNGMPIEEMKDLLSSKNVELLNYGINESSLYSIISSGQGDVIVDEESDYISHFECTQSFTYQDFSNILKKITTSNA